MSSTDYRRWRTFATPALLGSIALLILVLIPGVPTEQGLRRSLSVGPISVHAAEVAKLALTLFLANFFANRGHLMAHESTLYPALVAIAGTFFLVLIAPDLGTAAVVAGIGFALFFTAGAPLRWVFGTALMAVAVSVIGIANRSYQAARLNNWLDPFSDPTGGSYQTLQGLIAIATGGIFGTGIGTSQQPGGVIIPYAWNDYIFAVVGEELGFLGAIVVIGAFIVIAIRGLRVARHAPDTFGALLATGIVVWICGQAFLNIGVVLAILPVTGIPLPLLSQGGSSLFVLMCAIGLLLSVSRETMGAQENGGLNARGDRGRRYGGTPLSGPRRSSYAPTSTTGR
ncbi:MAG: FtsW/RodA/SpoVE family cell cycle protein [Candidatus Limnocylindrus sp.]